MGGKISSSLFGICIVLLLAYLMWELAKTAIDRRLAAEGRQGPDVPASRMKTLLPLLRMLILITIVVMATMSFLAALGVDILPLLAGASVVGVAIGFGSQTLVRDIVSGAFFLMDDAFRLGEYIEVGTGQGRGREDQRAHRYSCATIAARSTSCPTARSSGCGTRAATGSST